MLLAYSSHKRCLPVVWKFFCYQVPCNVRPSYSSWSSDEYQYLQISELPTMHFQRSLPRLPIPELDKTCERYLTALKPIMPADRLEKTKTFLDDFRCGEGKVLQEELKTVDQRNKHTSYICGPWFDMYLKSRVPLVLNYNPFMAFRDDPCKEYNDQLLRATNMLISSLRFLRSLRGSVLEPEVFHLNPSKSDTPLFKKATRLLPESFSWYGAYLFKAFPLDMSQFSNLFNSTRIPQAGKDVIQTFPESRHILVLRNGCFYTFDVIGNDGKILPPSHIFNLLAYVLAQKSSPPAFPIAVLTTEERDTWAQARQHLEQLGNGESLHLIDSALFALVLDEESLKDDILTSAHHMLHGPVANRWFDKSFQLIISKDGKAAINFEHAWGDGVAVLRFFNEVFKDSTERHFVGPETVPANIDPSQLIRKLDFKLDEVIKGKIANAMEHHKKSVGSLQLNVLQYREMNRERIKSFKLSPDSIVQLGFQMAFYKLYSRFVASYESCSTSAFKHGRTETVRPATAATEDCVEAFHQHQKPTPAEMRAKLNECTRVHNQLTKEAAMGQGFDRHLFALKNTAEKMGKPLPELYKDQSYTDANHFVLSTSTLFGAAFSGGGFGPVTVDGFGIAYGFVDDTMGCLVSSYSPYRDGAAFVEALQASFNDIHNVLVKSSKQS